MFVAASEIRAGGNPFYRALDRLLRENGFDGFAEETCREFYAGKRGRPGVPPGVYFRMLMVGYLEGIGSERGIAWRCADSFSLREFLGYGLAENPPEHSTLSKTRKRLSVEAHAAVFGFVLERLEASGLLRGKTLGVDATTLEANAAMRTIVRRDDAMDYEEWLEQLARASGIETPTREDLAKLDRKRPKKGSNKDWVHPHDPEARITKMKDGRTHLAHKLEHAVDMETGVVVGLTVQTMDGEFSDLRVQVANLRLVLLGQLSRALGEHLRNRIEQLPLPRGDLVGVKLVPRRNRLHAVALLQCLQRHPALERRRESSSLPGHLGASCSVLESTLTTCPKNRDHLMPSDYPYPSANPVLCIPRMPSQLATTKKNAYSQQTTRTSLNGITPT